MAVDETDPNYEHRRAPRFGKIVCAFRIYEEQRPETSQVSESEAWRVKWLNLRSQRGFRANPMAKQPFLVALTNTLFLGVKEVDDDMYHHMALFRS
jgi:hypothetical protein